MRDNKRIPPTLTLAEAQTILKDIRDGKTGKIIPFDWRARTEKYNQEADIPMYALLVDNQPPHYFNSINVLLKQAGYNEDNSIKRLQDHHIKFLIYSKVGRVEGDRLIKEYQRNVSGIRMGAIAERPEIGLTDLADHGPYHENNVSNKCFAVIPKSTLNAFLALTELPPASHQQNVQSVSIKPGSSDLNRTGVNPDGKLA